MATIKKKKSKTMKKAAPKKAASKKTATKKATLKKSTPKKATSKKAAPKKATSKKAAPKKTASKKAVTKKAAPKKTTLKKTASKKAAPKKTAAKKASPKKSGGSRGGSFKREITKQLLATKLRILSEVQHLIRNESDDSKITIGDIYDIASNERERELLLTIGDRERAKLSEVEDALERISDKTYGECGDCGEPIGENRLRAMPFTRVCIECKSRTEREHLIRGKQPEDGALGILEKADGDDDEF